MSSQKATFVMKEMNTFPLRVDLVIPPENPIMRGYITVDAVVKSKEEFKVLAEADMDDVEYFAQIVQAVHGLGDANGNPIEGEAAMREVQTGRLSMYYIPAIVSAYFEQYGEARQKNSRKSSRR